MLTASNATTGRAPLEAAPDAMLDVEQARGLLLERSRPVRETETLATNAALGRVLASPLRSPIDLPAADHAAMDGYAARLADWRAHPDGLPVSQRVTAGMAPEPLAPGACARIFTGALLPPGADTLVIQEDCVADGQTARLAGERMDKLTLGANIRRRGEELAAGESLLSAGTRLGPQHLALAAAAGYAELPVNRRLRVAILTTGDELIPPGTPLAPGQVYNANRLLMQTLLDALGCTVLDLGNLGDDRDATLAMLAKAASEADLVLISGGVSVGEEDHVRPAVEQLGTLHVARLAMRPGKPVAFGQIGDTPLLGGPGNPVSLFVVLCLFARPLILAMQGVAGDLTPTALRLPAGFDWPKPDRRREYHRARLETDVDGRQSVSLFPSRSSAALTSLTWANGLAVLPPGQSIRAGEAVDFLPFFELLT